MIERTLRTLAITALAACGKSEPPPEPTYIDTKAGRIEVADKLPPNAELMCSTDLKVYPRSQIHVVPMYQPSLNRYIGSYRCDTHWKQTIAETRARFAHNPTDDEGAAILQVFLERGVTPEQARVFTAGKPIDQAVPAMLDALEAGRLELNP